jgi:MATE family multidrug resistance protein
MELPTTTGAAPGAVAPAGSVSAEAARLLRLAWPMVVGQVGLVTMGMVDIAVAGRVDEAVLGEVAAGRIWGFGVFLFGLGVLKGLDPVVSQAYGRGDAAALQASLGHGLLLAALLSVPVGLLHLVAAPALGLLGQDPVLLDGAGAYAAARAPGVPAELAFIALSAWLQGQGLMRPPMIAVVVGNVVNLVLTVLLVIPGDRWGLDLPQLGATGCGIATALTGWVMMGILLISAGPALGPGLRAALADRAGLRELTLLGLPVGVQIGMEVWAFNASGLMVGTFGGLALAANAVAMQIISFTFMVPFALGGAAAVRVGHLVGARMPFGRAAGAAVGLSIAWMALSAGALRGFGEPILRIFTDGAAVLQIALTLLPVAAAFQVFDGAQASLFGALRGAGDTRVPALANLLGYWCLALPLAALWIRRPGAAPADVWAAMAVGLAVVAGLLGLRLAQQARRHAAALSLRP